MLGNAFLYGALPGSPAAGESKVKDSTGKEWDIQIPGGFHFQFVKDDKAKNGNGFALKRTEVSLIVDILSYLLGSEHKVGRHEANICIAKVTADTGPLILMLLRRGVMKPADLGLA